MGPRVCGHHAASPDRPPRSTPVGVAHLVAVVIVMMGFAPGPLTLASGELPSPVPTILAQVTALGGKVIFGSLIIVVGIFLARIVANLVGSGTGEGDRVGAGHHVHVAKAATLIAWT